jgi:hypothetical protein
MSQTQWLTPYPLHFLQRQKQSIVSGTLCCRNRLPSVWQGELRMKLLIVCLLRLQLNWKCGQLITPAKS